MQEAADDPGCVTTEGIDAEKVAWGGKLRQRRGATEEVSLLRPSKAAARESGIRIAQRSTGITEAAVGQTTRVKNKQDVRRYTRQE